jgi:hypothetical protein
LTTIGGKPIKKHSKIDIYNNFIDKRGLRYQKENKRSRKKA